MASRKKINGKARRAAAAAKAKATKDEEAAVNQNQPLVGQLQMNDMAMSDGVAKCNHGLVPSHYHWHSHEEFLTTTNNMKQIVTGFLKAFVYEFDGAGGNFLAA